MKKKIKIFIVCLIILLVLIVIIYIFSIERTTNLTGPCEKDREFVENIKSDPECLWKGFRCIDGWHKISYYNNQLTDLIQTEEEMDTIDIPEELTDKIVAQYITSVCSCKKPVSYRILLEDKLEETNCENFYKFMGNYNSSCNGCVLTWKTNCC